MQRFNDKYGRGSAAVNGAGFVDLEPGEALEINQDADSERTPRGAMPKGLNSAPFQNLASQLVRRLAYYVGDVNRTKPTLLARSDAFSVETAAELVSNAVMHQPPTTNHQSPISDITVIILIGQEKVHLKRCVEKLAALKPRQIFLVESQPDDGGVAIAKETAAKLGLKLESKFNKWPGTQAVQFNWALENLPIDAGWILRLDADEYLLPELIVEIEEKLSSMPQEVDGVVLKRRHVFCGKWVKHGTYPTRILRLFRTGHGRCDGKLMDEHIVVQGQTVEFDHDFVDHSLISLEDWKEKHRGYAKREAQSHLCGEVSEGAKASAKAAYYKLPSYFRAVAYFCIRYFLKGGFLDGKAGWKWNFWQGLWYRWLVDREIGRLKRARG